MRRSGTEEATIAASFKVGAWRQVSGLTQHPKTMQIVALVRLNFASIKTLQGRRDNGAGTLLHLYAVRATSIALLVGTSGRPACITTIPCMSQRHQRLYHILCKSIFDPEIGTAFNAFSLHSLYHDHAT
jgi:hypothetical protein